MSRGISQTQKAILEEMKKGEMTTTQIMIFLGRCYSQVEKTSGPFQTQFHEGVFVNTYKNPQYASTIRMMNSLKDRGLVKKRWVLEKRKRPRNLDGGMYYTAQVISWSLVSICSAEFSTTEAPAGAYPTPMLGEGIEL